MEHTILIIDDEPNSVQAIVDSYIGDSQYIIRQASNGLDGLRLAKEIHPMVIILDILMSPLDGFEVMRRLQDDELTSEIPVVIFSATGLDDPKEERKIQAIMMGADYFLAKKDDLRELRAIVANIAHKGKSRSARLPTIIVGHHTLEFVDPNCNQVRRDGKEIILSHQLSELLCFFKRNIGRVVSINQIAREIYGEDTYSTKSAYRLIDRLRKKICPDPLNAIFIVSIPTHGYKLTKGET